MPKAVANLEHWELTLGRELINPWALLDVPDIARRAISGHRTPTLKEERPPTKAASGDCFLE
jgi:hypothetical protein